MRVAGKSLLGHRSDAFPDSTFVPLANCRNLVCVEVVAIINFVRIISLGATTLCPLTLDLVKHGDVLVEFYKSHERGELVHDSFIEVGLDAECPLHELAAQDFSLLCGKLIIFSHLDSEGVLVCIVVQVNETIVEKETGVALLAVRVIDLFSTLDVLKSFDDKALTVISVTPACLSGALVIEHVGIRDEAVGLDSLDLDAEDTTSDHHADLRVLFEGELAIVRNFIADGVIVLLNISDLFRDLVLERTSLEPCALVLGVKDREVVKGLGQDVDVLVKWGSFLSAFLHDVGCQERMLW